MAILSIPAFALAADKPNIILSMSDDTGWGDLGAYGGGEGRGAPTPNLDRMADEGMTMYSFYGQPSCTPGRGAKGTVREGGNRVPAIAWWPAKIKAGARNSDILGSLGFMATYAALAGTKLPEKDREGKPVIFDSYDMTPALAGTGKSARGSWLCFTEDELTRAPFAPATTRPSSTCAATTGSKPASWLWTRTSAGRARTNMWPPCPKSSTCGRIPRNATTCS